MGGGALPEPGGSVRPRGRVGLNDSAVVQIEPPPAVEVRGRGGIDLRIGSLRARGGENERNRQQRMSFDNMTALEYRD